MALTENRPAYGRKLKDFPRNIAQLVLSMMLEMDEYDLAEWNAKVHQCGLLTLLLDNQY